MAKKKKEEGQVIGTKFNREEFLKALQLTKPGLGNNGDKNNFSFTGNKLVTNNDLISISVPMKTDFILSVPSKELLEIISSMSDIDLFLHIENDRLNLSCGKTKAAIRTFSFFQEEIVLLKEFLPIPKDFLIGLDLCRFSASKDLSFDILGTINIDNKTITSSDNFRISQFTLEKNTKLNINIPTKNITDLIKLPITSFRVENSWIQLKTDNNIIFSIRLIEGDYPKVDNFLKIENGRNINFPKELKNSVAISFILSEGEQDIDKRITIEVKKNKIVCIGQNEIGKIITEVDFESDKEFTFDVNPIFFMQILDTITSVTIGENKALFESENFKHIMCLPINE